MKGADLLSDTKALVILGGVGLALYLGFKLFKIGPGLLSGNNALTQNATNASGQPTTAYVGQGAVGTLGAATNAVSGGYLASAGEWLGSTAYNLFNTDPNAQLTSANAATTGNVDAANAMYQNPIDYGSPGEW